MEEYGDNNVRGGDLTDTGKYVRRFKRFYLKDDWDDIFYIVPMFIFMTVFIVDKYIVTILPGGVE